MAVDNPFSPIPPEDALRQLREQQALLERKRQTAYMMRVRSRQMLAERSQSPYFTQQGCGCPVCQREMKLLRHFTQQGCDCSACQREINVILQRMQEHYPRPNLIPDHVTTLTAWRGWKLNEDFLHGIGTPWQWIPREAIPAICFQFEQSEEHKAAPVFDCFCGYWSFKSLDQLTQSLAKYEGVTVIGSVDIWGRIVECEHGYRSEFAYPKELFVLEPELTYGSSRIIHLLSSAYGVPVSRFTGLQNVRRITDR